jgi:hypothetical protein
MYLAPAQFKPSALTRPNFAATPPRTYDSSVHMTKDWTIEETRRKIKCIFYSETFVPALCGSAAFLFSGYRRRFPWKIMRPGRNANRSPLRSLSLMSRTGTMFYRSSQSPICAKVQAHLILDLLTDIIFSDEHGFVQLRTAQLAPLAQLCSGTHTK